MPSVGILVRRGVHPASLQSDAGRLPSGPRSFNLPDPLALPSILTLKEVSKELRCSKAHLSHIINGKVAGLPTLPVARIGRRVIIRREVFLRWLWSLEGRDETIESDLNSSLETHGKE